MADPVVSFLMPTYGRFPAHGRLLEEAVYWFTRQEYPAGRAELVLLNDDPAQTLLCDVDGVRVVNLPERLPTLGAKRNLLIDLARGDILLPWDDDDVSLPGRAAQAAGVFVGMDVDYWEPQGRWYEESGRLMPDWKNCTHHASAFLREAGLRYRADKTCDEDQWFSQDAFATGRAVRSRNDKRDYLDLTPFTYVYRWGVSPHHLSAQPDPRAWYSTRPSRRAAWEAGRSEAFRVEPRMGRDYEAECRALVAAAREREYGRR